MGAVCIGITRADLCAWQAVYTGYMWCVFIVVGPGAVSAVRTRTKFTMLTAGPSALAGCLAR